MAESKLEAHIRDRRRKTKRKAKVMIHELSVK